MRCEVIGSHKVCGVAPGNEVDIAEADLDRLVRGGHVRPAKGDEPKVTGQRAEKETDDGR